MLRRWDYIANRYHHKPQDGDARWDWSGAVDLTRITGLAACWRSGRLNWYPTAEFAAYATGELGGVK
jgi:hypothetical protein